MNIPLIPIQEEVLTRKGIKLYLLREDLIHPEISGNKWRKLKYNLLEAKKLKHKQLLTFGGAYSNHIAATAAAGKQARIHTIGIIRGEEMLPLNPTLQLAKENGMELKYISRSAYKNKYNQEVLHQLENEVGSFYLIPEGGTNLLAVKGCAEIMDNVNVLPDVICCACGTGGTLSGIIAGTKINEQVIGFPALKGGEFLKEDILELLERYSRDTGKELKNKNWDLITDYHFGGYAKIKPELIEFVHGFREKHHIPLDYVYTGKMLFGIYDRIEHTDQFDGKTIIAIHTGGLQGNKGFEQRLGIKQ